MRALLVTALLTLLSVPASGQTDIRKGTVTYLSGDVIYTSLGRSQGVTDSSRVYVVSGADTTAILLVFAVSSTSSACRMERGARLPSVGDRVIFRAPILPQPAPAVETPTSPPPAAPSQAVYRDSVRTSAAPGPPPPVDVHGRLGLQYFTTRYGTAATKVVQPGVSLNLQGSFRDIPLKFEMYGNVRGIAYGTQNPFASGLTNRTRIYRMFVGFDDGVNRIALGRVIPTASPSIGYVDGVVISRTSGPFTLGAAGGFEPDFNQRDISTDLKKYAVFGNFQTSDPFRIVTSVSYARTYFQTLLNREVVSGSALVLPTQSTFFSAQSDVDLRTKVNQEYVLKPKLTSLYAAVNHRLTDILTVSLGMNAWRPFYPFQSVMLIPDSLLDRRLQASPSAGISLFLSPGISFSTTYSPRTSDEAFGKEYTEYSTFGINNVMNQGVSIFGNVNWNVSGLSRTTGYGANLQKSITELAVVTLRFQEYRYTLLPLENVNVSQSIAMDLMLSVTRSLMVWGSVERLVGLGADGYSGLGEVSWRF